MSDTVFNPNKNYTWKNDEIFPITGTEFGITLNSLRAILSTPEAQRIILAQQALTAMELVLKKGVTSGAIKEAETTSSKLPNPPKDANTKK